MTLEKVFNLTPLASKRVDNNNFKRLLQKLNEIVFYNIWHKTGSSAQVRFFLHLKKQVPGALMLPGTSNTLENKVDKIFAHRESPFFSPSVSVT